MNSTNHGCSNDFCEITEMLFRFFPQMMKYFDLPCRVHTAFPSECNRKLLNYRTEENSSIGILVIFKL